MGDGAPRLHVVGPGDGPGPRRLRPGPAVLSVLAYSLLFGGALWYLRARSPLAHRPAPAKRSASPRAGAPAAVRPGSGPPFSARDREALLSGEAVAPSARAEYFRHLASDHCDCGCERTLSDCLANEKSCSRSPQQAQKWIPDSGSSIPTH